MLFSTWRPATVYILGILFCVRISSVGGQQEDPLVPLCFCAVRSTNYTHSDSELILPFDNVIINEGDGFDPLTHSFTVPANRSGGYFWLTWTIGIPAATYADVRITGTPRSPNLLRNHSVFTSGADTTSRSELVYLDSDNETVALSSRFSLYSDSGWQTSFFGFSLSDTMSEVVAFSVGRSVTMEESSTVIYDLVHVDTHAGFNILEQNNSSYFIQRSGLYVVTFSMAAVPGSVLADNTQVFLYSIPPERPIHVVYTVDAGVDVVSQTVIVNMLRTQALFTWVGRGPTYSDIRGYQTSMMGFLYSPQASPPLAWSVFTLIESFEGPIDPIPFELVFVDTESGWNNATSTYTVQATGTYYIHMTAGISRAAPAKMELLINGEANVNVYRESTDHLVHDMRSRAIIQRLAAGDQLTVRLPAGYRLYNTVFGELYGNIPATQFMGFCIYN